MIKAPDDEQIGECRAGAQWTFRLIIQRIHEEENLTQDAFIVEGILSEDKRSGLDIIKIFVDTDDDVHYSSDQVIWKSVTKPD